MSAVRHVFVQGPPEIGKSTLVQKVLRRLGMTARLGGFYTVEERDTEGNRTGFRSISVADPSCVVQLAKLTELADLETDPSKEHRHRVGPFTVNLDTVADFVASTLSSDGPATSEGPATKRANHGRQLIVLDELGAMQLLSPRINADVESALGPIGDENMFTCFGTLPPMGLHDLPFVESVRNRQDVLLFTVAEENRNCLVDEVWQTLLDLLHPATVASQIKEKGFLARRYVVELSRRLEGSISEDNFLRFRGDHGVYELTRSRVGDPWHCTCPFFREHTTCSHTLALVLCEES